MRNQSCICKLGRYFVLAWLVVGSNVFAGYVYDLSQTEYQDNKPSAVENISILVDGVKMKLSGMEKSNEMIFDGGSKAMVVLDHERKSYFQIDEKSVAEISAKLDAAMAEMEAQLANMPPAQRAMMENMMKGKMPQGGQERPESTIVRTGKFDTISGYKAERVDVQSSDGKSQELWVAPWSALGGSEEVVDAFSGMSSLFNEMLGAFSQGPMAGMFSQRMQSGWMDKLKELDGFPVASKTFDQAGKLVSETMLSNIEEREIPASEFNVPKGYKQQKMKM